MNLSDYDFRDLFQKCVIIKADHIFSGAQDVLSDQSYSTLQDMDAALCYCYIDPTHGITFHFLCTAIFETGAIDQYSYEKIVDAGVVLMFRAGPAFEIYPYTGDVSPFRARIDMVEENYHKDKNVLPTRSITKIDHLRHDCNPDDILAVLYKDGLELERPWVRLTEINDGKLYGVLINEPHQDFGVHYQDNVQIIIAEHEGQIYAVINII